MKRAGITFLALTTLLCGLFFLTACKKGPLSLDQQFDVYSKAKPVSISDGETYYLWIKDSQDKTVDSLKYMIPKEWELDLEQSLKPNEDVAYTAQEDGRYFLVQIYTLRIQGNQNLSEKALKQTMMDDGHRFSKEGKVTIGDKEWLTGYERSEQANKASAISFYRLEKDSSGNPMILVGNFLYPTYPGKGEDDVDALVERGIGHLKTILKQLSSQDQFS